MNEFNVLIGNWEESDKDLFFGPLTAADQFVEREDSSVAKLLLDLGLFSSVGQAKKAGWNIPIPDGFSDWAIGKKRTRVTILKIT